MNKPSTPISSNERNLESWAQQAGSLFEAAWRPDRPLAEFASHLPPPGDPRRPAVLRELAARDLELRLVHGLSARVEDYLDRYPELRADREAVLDLLRAEYDQRRLTEPNLDLAEFRSRFPEHADEMAQRLPRLPTLPDYEVLEEVGRGGMGIVYKARHRQLGRVVVLKMILAGACSGEAERKRFDSEARAVECMKHPNIVQIYEVGTHEGRPFLALEYCAGGSLADRTGGTPWPPEPAARLVETLARAVHHAHKHNIIHRDLKPGNILLANVGGVPP